MPSLLLAAFPPELDGLYAMPPPGWRTATTGIGAVTAAVATLRRDIRLTLTYYQLRLDQPGWQRRFLRTTSRLERFNRALRKRCRTAGAYHSDDGLQAMIAQTADLAFQADAPAGAKRHTIPTE